MPITENLIESLGFGLDSGLRIISSGYEVLLSPRLNKSAGIIEAAAIPAAEATECFMKLRLLTCILYIFEMKIDKIKFRESTIRKNVIQDQTNIRFTIR
jgi:hypothetical protein